MTGDVLRTILEIGYFGMVVFSIILALVRRRESEALLGWILAIVFLPVIGMLLFYLVGWRRTPRRLERKLVHGSEFSGRLRETGHDERPDVAAAVEDTGAGWQGIGTMARELGVFRRREGNRVELLTPGEDAFNGILAAIEKAEHHVHVEKFILRHDGLGERFVELLERKAAGGVEVRLLVDAYGSVGAWRLLRRLRRAGGQAAVFMPLFPLGNRFAPNLRNHRKIVICDGKVGFFGGLNIGEEYLGRRKKFPHWCDAHMEVQGPAVRDLQRVFVEDWDFATGELLSGENYFPLSSAAGDAPVQIVSAGPDQEINAIHQIYFTAITRARRRLFIASPYVVPTLAIRTALVSAALRGVEVEILTQGSPPDHWLPYWAACYFRESLLTSGVRLFEYRAGMMHAKVLVVDGEWASVGSANLDYRSVAINFELLGLFDRPREVEELERRFRRELDHSEEIYLEGFRRRTWPHRLVEAGAHLMSPLL